MFPFRLSIFFLFALSCKNLGAQPFEVPKPAVLQDQSDYDQYRETFLQCADWLIRNDINIGKRAKVNVFAMTWISGTPEFSITLEAYILDLTDENPDLLMVFLSSWGKFALEQPAKKDQPFSCNWQALNTLLDFYESSQKLQPDKDVEKLVKLRSKGKLEQWLQQQLKL